MVGGGPAGVPAAASIRWRAASTAVTSAEDNAAPSARDATRITGALSPSGKPLANAETRADSADAGMGTGEAVASAFCPPKAISAPAAAISSTVINHDQRAVTTAANRSHDGMASSILRYLMINQIKEYRLKSCSPDDSGAVG